MSSELNRPVEFDSNLDAPTSFTLSGRRLLLARLGWLVVFILTLGLYAASIPAYYDSLVSFSDPELDAAAARASLEAAGVSMDFYARYLVPISVAYTMVYFVVGTVIFWRRSDNWMALFASMCLITMGIFGQDSGSADALADQYSTAWLPVHLLALLATVSIYTFVLIFPNGRFVPRWTRWAVIFFAVHDVFYYLFPDSIFNLARSFYLLDAVVLSIVICVPIVSQLYRYRYVSTPVERQQTKWVVFGVVSSALGVLAFEVPISGSPLGQFGPLQALAIQAGLFGSQLLLPVSIGIAIIHDRLWDIHVIINRTLVYGSLSACVVLTYVLTVGGLGALFQARGNLGISLLATGIVAVLFQPLRARLQRGVNRLMYGERDDPYAVTSRLGRRIGATLTPEAVLPTVVETVAQALKLPYAAILLKEGENFRSAAAYGSPVGDPEALPLVNQRKEIGRLVISPRAPGEGFSNVDRRLLEDLARQAEVAVHAVRLTADLQSSRERLVTTREEERRRLRRDLHDGLGPTLASLVLKLDAARKMVRPKPADAEEMLSHLKNQARDTVGDVRRLVYGLRPPALDDLGLVAAIGQQAEAHSFVVDGFSGKTENEVATVDGTASCSIEAPDDLPLLPAAVEVAAYRIVQEALTNIARHSHARTCRVRISVDRAGGALTLEVRDDGVGMPEDHRAGVGLSSMCERAEELGGRCDVEPDPEGGTRVLARLPLPTSEKLPEGARSS